MCAPIRCGGVVNASAQCHCSRKEAMGENEMSSVHMVIVKGETLTFTQSGKRTGRKI
jgi:hypothetical protein